VKFLDKPDANKGKKVTTFKRGNSKLQSMESSIAFETMNGMTTSENESAMAKEENFL
jgi:hypothetical protein